MALSGIDSEWFKARHRQSGITQAEAAAVLGKAPTFLTRIYSGDQTLRLEEARRLASLFQVPLSQIVSKAGLAADVSDEELRPVSRGMAEAPAEYEVKPLNDTSPPELHIDTSHQIWSVGTPSLAGFGVLPGDKLSVDPGAKARTGDLVVAQIYDWRSGTAETVLRGYNHPYLVRSAGSVADMKPETVDNERVLIKGVVTLVWRTRAPL